MLLNESLKLNLICTICQSDITTPDYGHTWYKLTCCGAFNHLWCINRHISYISYYIYQIY